MDTKIARNLSIKQIRAFVSVATHRSFSKAAQELAISQPALSLSVQQLEEIIGANLLHRTTRSVSPTKQGAEFLPKAKKILREIENAVLATRASGLEQQNRVKIAALPSVAIRVLPAVIRDFAEISTSIKIAMADDNGRGVQEQVLTGKADFGISNIWTETDDLTFTPFIRDRVGLICRGDHALARGKPNLSWTDLDGLPFVGMASDTGISRLYSAFESQLPISVSDPTYSVLTISALVGLVETGEAVSALPALAAPDFLNPSLVYRELSTPHIYRDLYLITSSAGPLSAAVQRVFDYVADSGQKISAMFPNSTVECLSSKTD